VTKSFKRVVLNPKRRKKPMATVKTTHESAETRPHDEPPKHSEPTKPPEPPKTYKVVKEFVDSSGARWAGGTGLSFSPDETKKLLEAGNIEEEKPEELKK
jgi:hypothetical protein